MRSQNRVIKPTPRGIHVSNCEQVDYAISASATNTYVSIPFGGKFAPYKWLEKLASLYSFYRVHRIRVHLFSTCPSTQRGDVTLAWCPDVLDAENWVSASSPDYIYNFPVVTGGPCWAGDGSTNLSLDIGPVDLTTHTANPWKRIGIADGTDGYSQVYSGSILYQLGNNTSTFVQGVGNVFVEYDIEFAESTNSTINTLRVSNGESKGGGIIRGSGPPQSPMPTLPTPPPPPSPPSPPKPQ